MSNIAVATISDKILKCKLCLIIFIFSAPYNFVEVSRRFLLPDVIQCCRREIFFRRWLEVSLMVGSIIFNGWKYHFSKFAIRGVSYGWKYHYHLHCSAFCRICCLSFFQFFFVAETKVYRKSAYL